ncbi:MAG: DUF4212 domain-containing protein [Hyphomicrobium sp.]|nr:DUF4212 domain-containing protein [Hyphomicrobium sp.]
MTGSDRQQSYVGRSAARDFVSGASRPTMRLLVVTLSAWVVLTLVVPLTALTLNAVTIAGFPLGLWLTAQGLLGALAALSIIFAIRARGVATESGPREPLAFAGEAIGTAGVLGFTGAIATLGYDGLALPLGLTAGLALMAILVAPRFVLYPVRSIGGFFTVRYGGVWPRRTALAVAGLASILLLAADIRGGALVLQGLIVTDYASAVAMSTVAVAAAWLLTTIISGSHRTGFVYVALLGGFAVILIELALRHGSWPIPLLSYGQAIGDLAAMEQKLVIDKLSDVKSLRPMSSPFLQLSAINFAGFVMALALGSAVLPHLLGRHASQAVVLPGDAARRASYATSLVAVFLMGLAAFAVFARLGVAEIIAKGIENALVPDALLQARSFGWVEICGPAPPQASAATVAADIMAACAKASGQRGFLRMQDIAFTSDSFVVAAPLVIGLPAWATLTFWAAGLLAALASGNAILSGYLAAGSEARGGDLSGDTLRAAAGGDPAMAQDALQRGPQIDVRGVTIAVVLLLAASGLAVIGHIEIPSLVSEGLALIAAGLFPALVLGLYWRRMTAAGAISAMLVGTGITAAYIIGVRAFPVEMYEWTGLLSNAAPNAVRKFELLRDALAAAQTDEARQLVRAALHRHASTLAGWGGLKPAASVVFALPMAVTVGVVVALLHHHRAARAAT